MGSRIFTGVAVVALSALGLAAPTATAAAAASAPTRAVGVITHAQTGSATATQDIFIFDNKEEEFGQYSTRGQLGSGTYIIETSYDDSHCEDPAASMTLTGTAFFTRSDGATLSGTVTGTEGCGFDDTVPVALVVDLPSGDRDLVNAHLSLTGTSASHTINPDGETDHLALQITGSADFTKVIGYWMVSATGIVTGFGGLDALGDAPTTDVTHLEPTPDHHGYWIVDGAGHVYAFGDARWLGNAPATQLAAGETVTNLSATPTGAGYWLFTSRGRALTFGDATFFGDMRAVALNGPVIGAIATPTGRGYYMVASDGGVFTFGDAVFRGSMGAVHLNRPVNGLVPTLDNTGYWLVASDGGIFAFDAPFLGSTGALHLNRPVIGMARYGSGYLMVASDGGIFTFSAQAFFGSLGGVTLPSPIVGVAATS